ncbi:hypothetical protein, partial [Pseudomonas aeruginosa]|uniref:hypothetical protein n=1 Tax=Pseudomonas aeruginosa TaxID=287 RepID=UPI001F0491ED
RSRCYRNERSRVSEMTGHDQPKRPVTVLRNPHRTGNGPRTMPEIRMGDPLHRTSQGERSMLGKAEKLSVLVVFELRLIILFLFLPIVRSALE